MGNKDSRSKTLISSLTSKIILPGVVDTNGGFRGVVTLSDVEVAMSKGDTKEITVNDIASK